MKQQIKTKSGFECEIDSEVLDDMEILDLLLEMEENPDLSLIYYNKLMKKMMDDDTRNRLYEHIRTEDGRVPATGFTTEINEIFGILKDGKKS